MLWYEQHCKCRPTYLHVCLSFTEKLLFEIHIKNEILYKIFFYRKYKKSERSKERPAKDKKKSRDIEKSKKTEKSRKLEKSRRDEKSGKAEKSRKREMSQKLEELKKIEKLRMLDRKLSKKADHNKSRYRLEKRVINSKSSLFVYLINTSYNNVKQRFYRRSQGTITPTIADNQHLIVQILSKSPNCIIWWWVSWAFFGRRLFPLTSFNVICFDAVWG